MRIGGLRLCIGRWGDLYLPQGRFGGGGLAITSRQCLSKPCPHLSMTNGSLPSPTRWNIAVHCMRATKSGWQWGQGDGQQLPTTVIRILYAVGWPSCYVWWRCKVVLRRRQVQRSCALIGDVEEGRGSWMLEVPSSVKPDGRHHDPIFWFNVLQLPPYFKSLFRFEGWRSRMWPPHPNTEGCLWAGASVDGSMLHQGSLAMLVEMFCLLICGLVNDR